MMVSTDTLVPMKEANQNFSKVTRLVDQTGLAVILKNNKPRYIVVDFQEYDDIQSARDARRKKIELLGEQLIAENMEALLELAK